MKIIEGRDEAGLPDNHPLRKVFESRQGSVAYHEFPACDLLKIALLINTPLFDGEGHVSAVAVLFHEFTRWSRIQSSLQSLREVRSLEHLYQAVVRGACSLGYARARLKQYDPQEKKLFGRAACGFTDPMYDDGYKTFAINVAEDPWSSESLDYQLPLLFIFDEVGKKTTVELQRTCLIRYCNQRLHEKELDKEGVNRWLDVPVFTPGARGNAEPWGVLTVDRGRDSDKLDASDAACISLFAHTVGMEIRSMQQQLYPSMQQVVWAGPRNIVDALADLLRCNPNDHILSRVVTTLLDYFLEETPADVVYAREFQGDALILLNEPRWRPGRRPEEETRPPVRIERGNGFSARLLELVDKHGKIRGGGQLDSMIFNDTKEETQRTLRSHEWSVEEKRLLEFGSAVYVPLVIRGSLRGTILALGERPNAFPPDVFLFASRFRELAEFWFELAELHDEQMWWHRNLKNVLENLPRLVTAPIDEPLDERFFAALTVLLTAKEGLGWHRAMLFSRDRHNKNICQLVHAVGGVGEKEHIARQEVTAKEWDAKLHELVDRRIADPRPIGRADEQGPAIVDPLYSLCVSDAQRAGNPWLLWCGKENPESPLPDSVVKHPLRHVFSAEHDPRSWWCLFLKEEQWLRDINESRGRRVFCSDITYVFPLWWTNSTNRELLGLVLVDMAYWPGHRSDATLTATRVVLDLVSNILAARYSRRGLWPSIDLDVEVFYRNMQFDMQGVFQALYSGLMDLLPGDEGRFESPEAFLASPRVKRLAALLENVQTEADRVMRSLIMNLPRSTPDASQEASDSKIDVLVVIDPNFDPADKTPWDPEKLAAAAGLTLHIARTKDDARKLMTSQPFDLAVIDHVIPDSGNPRDTHATEDVIFCLRQVQPACRVLAMSRGGKGEKERLSSAGAHELICLGELAGDDARGLIDRTLRYWKNTILDVRALAASRLNHLHKLMPNEQVEPVGAKK